MKDILGRISDISDKVTIYVAAKEELGLFKATFVDLRLKVREYKDKLATGAKTALAEALNKGLRDHSYDVVSAEVKLGRYRGSEFVTSAPVKVRMKSEAEAKKLEAYLQMTFDPKYKFKGWDEKESGVAAFNTR